ncbi:MAG: hypothetical protein GY729_05990 [Desulfobacteraceae bacterium]|nr:hypothetical protein [Desulfobacteraceae bacterium]
MSCWWAPIILANAGALDGKKATASRDFDIIGQKGGTYSGDTVTIDGNLITAAGPRTVKEFATGLVTLLEQQKQ